MPFGKAGVEPTLIVRKAVPSLPGIGYWWCRGKGVRSGQGWVGVQAWTPYPIPSNTFSFRRAWELLDKKVTGYVQELSGGLISAPLYG